MRQPINNLSRVPRYQNPLKVVGFCDFQVASPPYREGPWGGWMFFSFFSCAKKRTIVILIKNTIFMLIICFYVIKVVTLHRKNGTGSSWSPFFLFTK